MSRTLCALLFVSSLATSATGCYLHGTLWSVSPSELRDERARTAWLREHAEGDRAANPHSPVAKLNNAALLALDGKPEAALDALPKKETTTPPLTEMVAESRDWLELERQRRDFTGSVAVPDPRSEYAVSYGRVSLPATGDEPAHRFTLLEQTFSQDLGGLRASVPLDWYRETGSNSANFFHVGHVELTAQAFIGRASVWPNTKLTLGARLAFPTTRTPYDDGSGSLAALFGVAQRTGPLAWTLALLVNLGGVTGSLQTNIITHGRVVPFLGVRATTLFGARTGETFLALGSGVHVFLDARAIWQLSLAWSATREVDRSLDRAITASGLSSAISYRW